MGRHHRRQSIIDNKSRIRKTGARLIHALAPLFGESIRRRQQEMCESNNLMHIGTGAHSSVFLTADSQVLKIIRRSRFDDLATRRLHAEEMQEIIDITKKCHDDEALTTEVASDYLILRGKRQIGHLALRQDYIGGVDALRHPGHEAKVRDFATRSLDTMVKWGLAPDVSGLSNVLGIPNGNIVLVDTVPMSADDPVARDSGGYQRNLQRLMDLAG